MGDDESKEWAGLGDPPWLVSMLPIVPVEVCDGDGVDSRDGQRNLVGKRVLKGLLGNLKWVRKGGLSRVWIGHWRWSSIWRELKDGPRWELWRVYRGACAGHVDVWVLLCSYAPGVCRKSL